MFDSATTELIKKHPFFLKCSVLGGSGFIFRCPMRCPAQLEGRLATVWLPRLCPAVVGSALFAESLCYGGLPWQWQAALAMGVYLSRGRMLG